MDNLNYYRTDGRSDVEWFKGYVALLKRLNPDINVSIVKVSRKDKDTMALVTSKPIEQLIQPEGYYGNMLNRIIFPETYEEFVRNTEGDFLNKNMSSQMADMYSSALTNENPDVNISMVYDKDKHNGKITSSIPFSELQLPDGYYGSLGLDQDGNICYLKDRYITYSITDDFEFVETTQRYFDLSAREKGRESVTITDNVISPERLSSEVKEQPKLVRDEDLLRMAREKRKFEIKKRERTMNEEQAGRNRSSFMAGLCIIGALVAVHFNSFDAHQVIQTELDSIYSWEALAQYFKDLGPLTTLLAAAAGAFISKYLKHTRKYSEAQHELEDFNASLEETDTFKSGGNENDKTR